VFNNVLIITVSSLPLLSASFSYFACVTSPLRLRRTNLSFLQYYGIQYYGIVIKNATKFVSWIHLTRDIHHWRAVVNLLVGQRFSNLPGSWRPYGAPRPKEIPNTSRYTRSSSILEMDSWFQGI